MVWQAVGAIVGGLSAATGIAGAFKGDAPRGEMLANQIQGAFATHDAMLAEQEADIIVMQTRAANEASARKNALLERANALAQADALEATSRLEVAAGWDAVRAGSRESDNIRIEGARVIAAQQVTMARNGISVNGADAVFLAATTKAMVEEDAQAVRDDARTVANNFMQRGRNALTEAANSRRRAAALSETAEIARRNEKAARDTIPIIQQAGQKRREAAVYSMAASAAAPSGSSTLSTLSNAFSSLSNAATTIHELWPG